MSKVIAVFGAGPGLGTSMAQRFGREGYRVALVARNLAPLETLVRDLGEEGIDAHAFSADLSDPAQARGAVEAIRAHFGRIDVVEYGPIPSDQAFTSATVATASTFASLIPLYFLSPVEVVQAVLPEMSDRGEGAILITQGFSAVQAAPHFTGPGAVMAATRNYLASLNAELEGTGVYAATIAIAAALTRDDEAAAQAAASDDDAFGGMTFPSAHPDEVAARYWELLRSRDRVEEIFPAPAA